MLQDCLLVIKAPKNIVLRDYIWIVSHTSRLHLAPGIQFSLGLNMYPALYLGCKYVANLLIKYVLYLTIVISWSHRTSREYAPINGPLHATGVRATGAAISQCARTPTSPWKHLSRIMIVARPLLVTNYPRHSNGWDGTAHQRPYHWCG